MFADDDDEYLVSSEDDDDDPFELGPTATPLFGPEPEPEGGAELSAGWSADRIQGGGGVSAVDAVARHVSRHQRQRPSTIDMQTSVQYYGHMVTVTTFHCLSLTVHWLFTAFPWLFTAFP